MLGPADPTVIDENFSYSPPIQINLGYVLVWTEPVYDSPTSYAFNMCAVVGPLQWPEGVSDGMTNTVVCCEKYFKAADFHTLRSYPATKAAHLMKYDHGGDTTSAAIIILGTQGRRPSFADAGWYDVIPVTDPLTGVTRASVPGKTFQVKPKPIDADSSIPQTPFAAGLPVAMFDGSVRMIRPGVSEHVFWSAVTPARRRGRPARLMV